MHAVMQPVAEGLRQPVVEGQRAGCGDQEGVMLLEQGEALGAFGAV